MKLMQELDDMKKRLKEMEDEAAALREMQAKVEKEMGSMQGVSFVSFLLWAVSINLEFLGLLFIFSCEIMRFICVEVGVIPGFFIPH